MSLLQDNRFVEVVILLLVLLLGAKAVVVTVAVERRRNAADLKIFMFVGKGNCQVQFSSVQSVSVVVLVVVASTTSLVRKIGTLQ